MCFLYKEAEFPKLLIVMRAIQGLIGVGRRVAGVRIFRVESEWIYMNGLVAN